MARIKDSSVEAVKAAVDIVALVEGYTRLRKSGGRYVGLCPFHQEKTPSFGVSTDRGTFKCFGCGEGGDAIAFVEKQENLDFVGAIEFLADRFAVPLEYEETSPEQDRARRRRERLFQLLDRAATFYERYLWEADSARPAREYLASRGLGPETCKEFRLGLAPEGSTLTRVAADRGFTRDELAAAGLVNRRGRDYFHGRLLFPLADARGRVVGFQARKLRDDDPLPAKYVNSPEGDLFRKGDLLYGLDLARGAIAKQDRAVVVEGNTDVIALRQAGFHAVVAAMGTALTERQLKELGRLSKRLYLCFDADAAGQDATLRGMELAAAQAFDVRIVPLPAGSDPADEPEGFEERLRGATSYAVHLTRLAIDRADSRETALRAVRDAAARFVERSPEWLAAVEYAVDRLDLPREFIQGLHGRGRRAVGGAGYKALTAGDRLELNALAAVARHPSLTELLLSMSEDHFQGDDMRRLRSELLHGTLDAPSLATLVARAEEYAFTEEAGKEFLLRLRERRLQRELLEADASHLADLQKRLVEVKSAISKLA